MMTNRVTPILDELGIVLKHSSVSGLDHLILIDDARDFAKHSVGYPPLTKLQNS
jgi:hypothetical protein